MSDTPIFDQVCRWVLEERGIAYVNIVDDSVDLRPLPLKDPSNLKPVFPDVAGKIEPIKLKHNLRGWFDEGEIKDLSETVAADDPRLEVHDEDYEIIIEPLANQME